MPAKTILHSPYTGIVTYCLSHPFTHFFLHFLIFDSGCEASRDYVFDNKLTALLISSLIFFNQAVNTMSG